MSDYNYKWLQFFADGGASGGDGGSGGAGTGATSADAGQSTGEETADAGRRLEDLGVPRDKAEKYGKRMEKKGRIAASPSEPRNHSEGSGAKAPADSSQTKQPQQEAAPDWDTFMQIPENKQKLESMMAARGRSATEERNAAQEQMAKLSAALELLSARYGKEAKDGQYDIDGLVEAITGDDLFFEDKALETGESVDKVKSDWKKEREDAQRQQNEREQMLRNRFFEMQQQVPVVQQEYREFDFNAEMGNPDFVHMVNSKELGGMGWDLRKAYRAVHQDEIERKTVSITAQKAKETSARVVQSNQARPRENGTGGGAQVRPVNDYASARAMFSKMSPEQRLAYVKGLGPPR